MTKLPREHSFHRTIVIFFLSIFFFKNAFCQSHPEVGDEFVGPFASWINVVTQLGASGNGIEDDTNELQAAFDAVGKNTSTASVVYLPAGTYKITHTLRMNARMSISVIGADPATTKIVWAGDSADTMMQINGTAYSRFNRITWDGKGVAAIAIDQSWNGSTGYFDTGNEYADDVFTDTEFGIKGGALGHGFAETAIQRCSFIRNSKAGISLENFNALDIWIWHSLFDNCAIGVTNARGAGNFKVYGCNFRNSTVSDMTIDNNGEFSIRDNTSLNSKTFLIASFKRYPYNITLQSNTIIDPVANTAVEIRNQGPVALLDNIFRSREGATGPVVVNICDPSSEFFSVDNTFTVLTPILSNARNIIYDKAIVSRNTFQDLGLPGLPLTPKNLNRQVFEVPLSASAETIQNIVNQASSVAGTRPIVHFPHGTYSISSTINIPAGSDVQLVGDGSGDNNATWLLWTGVNAGPVIKINGPGKATLRDFSINGSNKANNILITNADQVGARVFMNQLESHLNTNNLFVNGLDNTLTLAYNSRFSSSSAKSVNVVGGPSSAAGVLQKARTIIFGGLGWDNNLSNEVSNGGNLLIRDVWYESTKNGGYLNMNGFGTFTLDGSHVTSPANTTVPQVSINSLSGKALFFNSYMQDRTVVSGNGSQSKVMALGVVTGDASLPVSSGNPTHIINTADPVADVRSFNNRSYNNPNLTNPRSGSYALNDIGQVDSSFIATMLQPIRNLHAQVLTPIATGITDVRLYRIWTYNSQTGLEIQGAGTVLPVQFLTFKSTCKNNNILFQWATSKEANIVKFNIEASEDGLQWKAVGSVPAAKSSEALNSYKFTLTSTSKGSYRIVAYSIDNNNIVGPTLKSSCLEEAKKIAVYPNPATTIAVVSISSSKEANIKILLFDSRGSLIKETSERVVDGNNKIPLNLENLPSGRYTICVQDGNSTEASNFIKR